MKQVAEIMYVVESERQAFLEGALHPDTEAQNVLWLCGVRNQQYYALNDLIFMTFEYEGNAFAEDMEKMAAYLETKGRLIKKRRKDVPVEERATTNWWAPVKRMATLLDKKPAGEDDEKSQHKYMAMLDGCMSAGDDYSDIGYDEDEWMENLQIWKS